MRQAVFFRFRLILSLQNRPELPTPILSLNLVQRLGGSHPLGGVQDRVSFEPGGALIVSPTLLETFVFFIFLFE